MADPLTIVDLDNGKLDLKTIEDVVSLGPNDGPVTSRLGQQIKTLTRAIQDVGFIDLQLWQPFTLYDDYQVLIEESGIVYTLNSIHTSGADFATDFADGKWSIYVAPSLALGTAASEDIVTSTIDTSVGRIPTVGWMGLGATVPFTLTDLNTPPASGMFAVSLGTLNKPSSPIITNGSVLVMYGQGGTIIEYLSNNDTDPETWFRSYDGSSWSAWESGDADTFAKSFGLGSTTGARWSTTDLNDINEGGLYNINGTDTNIPSGVGGQLLHIKGESDNAWQMFSAFDGSSIWVRSEQADVWGSWKRIDPQGFGLGVTSQDLLTDAEQIAKATSQETYFGQGTVDGTGHTFASFSYAGLGAALQLACRIVNAGEPPELKIRYVRGGIATSWQRLDPQGYGWGLDSGTDTSDLNTITTSGQYNFSNTTLNTPEVGAGGTVIHATRNSVTASIRYSQLAISSGGNTYYRVNINGVWGSWILTNPQAYGLGVDLFPGSTADLNTLTTTEMLYVSSSSPNAPTTNGGTLIVIATAASNATTQFFIDITTGLSYTRYRISGVWSSWTKLADSVNTGVGNTEGARWGTTDLNDIDEGGLYNINSGDTNRPPAASAGGTLLHMNGEAGQNSSQLFFSVDDNSAFYRTFLTPSWSSWVDVGSGGGGTVQTVGGSLRPASYAGQKTITGGTPLGISVPGDGQYAFVARNGSIARFSFGTPHDLSTLSTTADQTYSAPITIGSVHFSPDGTKALYLNQSNDRVNSITLTTPFDLTTLVPGGSVSISGEDNSAMSISVNELGTVMTLIGNNQECYRYTMSTPWDATTLVSTGFFATGNPGINSQGTAIAPDGTRIVIAHNEGVSVRLNEWVLQNANPTTKDVNISGTPTEVSNAELFITPYIKQFTDVTFSTDGKYIYCTGDTNDTIANFAIAMVK